MRRLIGWALCAAVTLGGCVAVRVAGDVAEGAVRTAGEVAEAGVDAAVPDKEDDEDDRR